MGGPCLKVAHWNRLFESSRAEAPPTRRTGKWAAGVARSCATAAGAAFLSTAVLLYLLKPPFVQRRPRELLSARECCPMRLVAWSAVAALVVFLVTARG